MKSISMIINFRVLIFSMLLLYSLDISAQSGVKLYQEDWTLPGYKSPIPDPNPIFFKNEAYQGASKFIYPYKLMDNIVSEKEQKTLKTIILENEFIRLCISPEIGGKLYYATDKTNGYNFVYKNGTFKPANVGMHGAWVSGGIEWCLIHHHRPSTFLPTDYELVENADGSKTVWVGETEERHRMRWAVGLTVFPGKSYFQTEVKIHNRTAVAQSFLYWANIATHVNENYQILFPPSVQNVMYHAKNNFAHWPIADEVYNEIDYRGNVDLSWWKNHPNPNSFFAYDLKQDFMGGYDHGSETGTVHIADHNVVKGAKLWEWGSGKTGKIWEKALSDTDGAYAELMVGAYSDNQPDYSWIKPYELKSFKQYWYPIKNIGGFKSANLNGAVNLTVENDKSKLAYYSTCQVDHAKMVLTSKGKVIFEKEARLSPDKTFATEVKLDKETKETDLRTYLLNTKTGDTLLSYQPVKYEYKKELPPVVEVPKNPSEYKTVEELYLTGSRIKQFHNATLDAEVYYNEALKHDPGDIRTNVALGNIYLKKANYGMAITHLRTAIKRLTANYTRPESCEALYLLGVALKATGQYASAIDTLNRAAWDYTYKAASFCELSKISCIQMNYPLALEQINKSLVANPENFTAFSIKANILRNLGNPDEAKVLLDNVIKIDPLDFFAISTRCFASGSDQQPLQDFRTKMRKSDQNYLELVTDFINIGQWNDAVNVLEIYLDEVKGNWVNPEAYYYLGYCNLNLKKTDEAKTWFKKGADQSVEFCFPFRFESIKVFQSGVSINDNDANAYYYLGNIYYDHQPQLAIQYWEKAVVLDPSFAIAFRNLGWGYYRCENNIPKAIAAYEKAIFAKNDDPMYYAELDVLYEINNTDLQTRLKLFQNKHEVVKRRADSWYREARVLNLNGEYARVIQDLTENNFAIREGQNHLREANVDASILLGRKFLDELKYNEALTVLLNAHYLPGKDVEKQECDDERMPQIDFYIGLIYKLMGNKKQSSFYFTRSSEYKLPDNNFLKYYQAMALLNLGQKNKADSIFEALVKFGNDRLSKGAGVDFFAKYGERETENMAKSNAYLLKGLGLKGLNKAIESKENLTKAVEFYASNIWAKAEM